MISLLNKFDDKYLIKEDDVLEIAMFFLKNYNLDNFLKDINFDNQSKYLAYYNLYDNNITINNERLWKYCEKNADRVKIDYHISDEYYSYFLNFYYISSIFHELTHAIQKKKYDKANTNGLYAYIYDLCRLLEYTDLSFYNANHDLFPLEIDATNNGYLKAYQLMTYTKLPGRETQIMHLEYLKSLLSNYKKLSDFKVITPLSLLNE